MTSGMARPRAWGQAMTSTVTVRVTAASTSPAERPGGEGDHAGAGGDVEEQGGEAVGQGLRPAARSLGLGHEPLDAGQRRVLARRPRPAPATAESVTTVPATTRSPGALGTGRDSPVTIDSSSSASPSTISAVGRDPPARPHEDDVARPQSRRATRFPGCRRAGPARPRRAAARPAPPAPTGPGPGPSSPASGRAA